MRRFVKLALTLLWFACIYTIVCEAKPDQSKKHPALRANYKSTSPGDYIFNSTYRLPIVFVYIVVPFVCPRGLPTYIRIALEQAIFANPDCDVSMISNYAECEKIKNTVLNIKNLTLIDSTEIRSTRTATFINASATLFSKDGGGELWTNAALRFFIMEDLMILKGWEEIMHIEADNMIYGRYSSLLPTLRSFYPMAATPLTAAKYFVTASVFWIGRLEYLHKFNDFLLSLGSNKDNAFLHYGAWLRRYACCKQGGVLPDKNGNGIKPFAVNEMSMLGYYNKFAYKDIKMLPVVPTYPNYVQHRYMCKLQNFAPNGSEVGVATGVGVWDPNSWGQHIGGTARKKGRDKVCTIER